MASPKPSYGPRPCDRGTRRCWAPAVGWLRANRFRVVAADPAAPTSYRDADYRGRIAIVVGSERHGLSPAWRNAADVSVSIPMLGTADSLNVGHAAALLLYQALDLK